MFLDRILLAGIVVSLASLALATALLLYVLTTLSTPQVVRLVSVVPSQGSIILDEVGDSVALTLRGYYSDLSLEDLDQSFVTYESTDPKVVTVAQGGIVTANGSGSAAILIEFGGFSKRVHALVFGDIPTLPPLDPSMVGIIGDLGVEIRVVLNRIIIELQPGYDGDAASDLAARLDGEVLFSYGAFPLHVIEFNNQARPLLETLDNAVSDSRVAAAYPDILFEPTDHSIETLSIDPDRGAAYRHAGFERAWRMLEDVAELNPVIISVIETGVLNLAGANQPAIIGSEFDVRTIHAPPTGQLTAPHAAAVTSIIAALNGNIPPSLHRNADRNFSGIVTSIDNLDYDLIALNDDQFLTISNVLQQLQTINVNRNAIDVVNMSFVGPSRLPWRIFHPLLITHEGRVKDMVKGMPEITFVPAAGNCQVEAEVYFPARFSLDLDNVITVGGANGDYTGRWTNLNPICNPDGLNGTSSAFGDAVTMAAPAKRVWTVDINNNGYNPDGGTSFAAPMVTGTIALLKALDADANPLQLRRLLIETADVNTICTSAVTPCPRADREDWPFLRADKAVARLLSDPVDAEISDRVTVPSNTQRIMGNRFEVGVDIQNRGEMLWPFYVEAFVRSPGGVEKSLDALEIAVAPRGSHPFRWGFWPTQPGCWDLRVKVWMDSDPASHLRAALAELNPDVQKVGLLADSGWREEVFEVRPDPTQEIQCSNSHQAIPLPKGLTQLDANVLLLADTSGSMEGHKIEALKQAVDTFINRMYDIRFRGKGGTEVEADYVGLSDFDDSYQGVMSIGPIESTGADIDTWQDAVDHIDAEGGTAFYDAVISSIDVLKNQGAPARNNILIALTDGLDQDSKNSLSDAMAALEASSITLFALALSEPGGSGDYDLEVLEDLANATGGAAYAADTDNLAGLYLLFSTIFETEP